MLIRNATTTDLDAIIALATFVQRQHADALPNFFKAPTNSPQTRDAFQNYLADSTRLMLLAEEAEPVGYLWAQFQDRPESWVRFGLKSLYIQHIAVALKFRRRGVGSLLLTKAVEIARQKGIKRVELDVWSFNAEAKRFYAKHGFEVFNERMAFRTDAP